VINIGDLVEIKRTAGKRYSDFPLGLVVGIQGGTDLYRVWLLGGGSEMRIFRFTELFLEKIGE
jgi:hypothetical protein